MDQNSFYDLMQKRQSVRAYLPDPVPQQVVEHIIETARLAPSGANLQPGEFHALSGVAFAKLKTVLLDAAQSHRAAVSEYSYFPENMSAELKARQRATGYALYDSVGITRRDVNRRREQFLQNYRFFDAPVGIVVCIQRDMGKGCFMDLGMAVMSLLLAAQSAGLGATGIGALANHADVVHDTLSLQHNSMVVCGIALGKPDWEHPINQFKTTREALEDYATFKGFDG